MGLLVVTQPEPSASAATAVVDPAAIETRQSAGRNSDAPTAPANGTLNDILVLGTARSGTSMMMGLLRNTPYYLGDDYIKRSAANPSGFFEDSVINRVNSELIARMWAMTLPQKLGLPRVAAHRNWHALWMATPAVRWFRRLPPAPQRFMLNRFARRPFCYKDPRFSITLPYWRPYLPAGTRFVVTFRDPQRTAASMVRQAKEGLRQPATIDLDWCLRHWRSTYARLLHDSHRERARWFFLNFDDLLTGCATPALQAFIGTKLDASHIDPQFSRQKPTDAVPPACSSVWRELLAEAEKDIQRTTAG
jgi:hypothetical protein